ncbi:MAG: DUF4252 domain-containing protein [Flavobacteriales bacterium]|nr:DUF4252 domain-containing protein [Flavobacteriales bacterium]
MKKLTFLIVLITSTTIAFSQNDALDKYFSTQLQDENFTKVTISSKMFELLVHVDAETEEEKELIETITKLSGMRILVKDMVEDGFQDYKNATKKISSPYEVLMTVDDNDEDMTFYILEKDGVIAELLMVLGGQDNFMILSIVGDIDLNQIAKLSRNLDIEGMENLQQLEK